MNFDLLWLGLFSLACALGWYLGQRERRVRRLQRGAGDIVDNRLLGQQSDSELLRLYSLLPVTADSCETHLAIARCFRQRGDLQQASSIHQNLLDSAELPEDQRARVCLELAGDFLTAGELSRAEWLLQGLVERNTPVRQPALQALQRIHERGRDWEKAIAVCHQLGLDTPALRTAAGHYHCEWAEQLKRRGDGEGALQQLGEALQVDPQCVRASLLLADWQREDGDSAIRHLLRVAEQDGDFLAEALPPLLEQARRSHSLPRLEDYLRSRLPQLRGSQRDAAVLTLVEVISERHGPVEASRLLEQELAHQPSLPLVSHLLQRAPAVECQPALRSTLLTALDNLQASQSPYRCRQCGFQARRLHWQCPACHGWSVIRRRD